MGGQRRLAEHARGVDTYRGPIWIIGRNVALTAEPEDALFEDKLRVACTHVGSDWIACLGAFGTGRRGKGCGKPKMGCRQEGKTLGCEVPRPSQSCPNMDMTCFRRSGRSGQFLDARLG